MRHLVVVLGDQLDHRSSAWDGFDATRDGAWMCEADEESTHAWSSKQRITIFLSAMRHFAQELRDAGVALHYEAMSAEHAAPSLAMALQQFLAHSSVERLIVTEPGEWRVQQALQAAAVAAGVPLEVRDDLHFLCSRTEFAAYASSHRQLRMEYFYREMRRRHAVLMDGDKPAGGRWNYDAENRSSFGPQGPGFVPPPTRFTADAISEAVISMVQKRFAEHPGRLSSFGWAVTRVQALDVLQRFIDERLPDFGHWQDAMWQGEPWLYHAHIASALNLKLLAPREVIAAAENAWRSGAAPLPAVEGFIRQILGWREYVRGVYWWQMPGYLELNRLDAQADLPAWYWTGDVPMRCLSAALTQTLEHGYAHHIQRLMVTGLYALLLGVQPKQVHLWYLSVYVDAVEWVELPNTLGMSQFGDGGLMASKPYVASGKYIDRMSNHCRGCRFDPNLRVGARACPYTTLYWDFLARHETLLAGHPRMVPQLRNLQRLDAEERERISHRAEAVRRGEWDAG